MQKNVAEPQSWSLTPLLPVVFSEK